MKKLSIPLLLSLFCFLTDTIYAKQFTYYIEWSEVKGSNGFIVEIQDETTKKIIDAHKVKNNYIEFQIQGGSYQFRIASVNKFGKPTAFSEWNKFTVDKDKTREDVLQKKEEPAKEETQKTDLYYSKWVPGLPQYNRGDTKTAYSYWFLFSGLAIAGFYEYRQGNILSDKFFNDPLNINLVSYNKPIVGLFLWQKRDQDKRSHTNHQRNQTIIGGIALLSYTLHLTDVFYLNPTVKEDNQSSLYYEISLIYKF
jgi:hypothetical protein